MTVDVTKARDAIAEAATSVPGLYVSPFYRHSTRPGDGVVRLERVVRDDTGFGWMFTWQVIVTLPQDPPIAEQFLDDLLDPLLDALGGEGAVTQVVPQSLLFDGGLTVPCVVVDVVRADDI